MVLVLSNQQLLAMQAHAERVYPEECCGLMLGEMQHQTGETCKQLVEIVPLVNQWDADDEAAKQTYTKHRRYSIDPKDMLRVQKQARSQGLNIIGVYHSHPDHVAEPSECDRAQAWPDYAYVIVSVQGQFNSDLNTEGKENNAKAVDIKNWTLDSSHQFQREAMKVSPGAMKDRMPVPA